MFAPNKQCRIRTSTGKSNLYGQPVPGPWVVERCAVVKLDLTSAKTAVRADSSASRGNAREYEADAVILLSPATAANIDDIIEIDGHQLRIIARSPRFDAVGRLDHTQIEASMWSNP